MVYGDGPSIVGIDKKLECLWDYVDLVTRYSLNIIYYEHPQVHIEELNQFVTLCVPHIHFNRSRANRNRHINYGIYFRRYLINRLNAFETRFMETVMQLYKKR